MEKFIMQLNQCTLTQFQELKLIRSSQSGLHVHQGDILTTTLFNIYINDLAKEIKDLNIGISIEDVKISIPMYADDIVLLAENEKDLHCFLDKLNESCMKWKMQVNQSKTNVVHFIKEKSIQNKCIIYFRECRFKVVDRYRYVGI